MKNPLNKRLPRELKSEFGKYLVIFLFIAAVIGLVSGFLVADGSLIKAYNESYEKYNIEDGNFELAGAADNRLIDKLEEEKLTVYNNYYVEEETKEVDSTLRIFVNRTEANLACLMEGEFPEQNNEIAIDRMYAENNKLSVGDTLTVTGEKLEITGLIALSDYSALFQNNSDMMFDAVKFGVGVMNEEGFESLGEKHLHYSYSWIYDTKPKNDDQAKEWSDNFKEILAENAVVTSYVPEYLNQAIRFTGGDMGSDRAMISMFLYIVVVIIAFIFAVTTGNTITKESAVIGTLRASGYKRSEMVRHYMTMPFLVTLAAGIVGNVVGYTFMKDFMAGMYYGSYSLPTYVTVWSPDAFIRTTVIPLMIMMLINFLILVRKLQLSPLRFLRHDLVRKQREKAVKLNTKLKIFTRFRLRIIMQNMSNYVTLVVGIFFANFIILFGMMLPSLLEHYQKDITSNLISDYQYVLKAPAKTDEKSAEKFALTSLNTLDGRFDSEEITVYGILDNSKYLNLDFEKNKVFISDGYAEKFKIKPGDTITLEESYGSDQYEFTVQGIFDYPAVMGVFMDNQEFVRTFDLEADYFNGYFSNTELKDVDETYIATTITLEDLTKLSRQLDLSMGSMIHIFTVVGTVMFILLIYLLSKLIIEKNAQSISMVKILGFSNSEINRLYILATSAVVVLACLFTIPAANAIMKVFVEYMFGQEISGWLPYYVEKITFVKIFLIGIVCYGIVALVEMQRIKRIPKSDALKNVE